MRMDQNSLDTDNSTIRKHLPKQSSTSPRAASTVQNDIHSPILILIIIIQLLLLLLQTESKQSNKLASLLKRLAVVPSNGLGLQIFRQRLNMLVYDALEICCVGRWTCGVVNCVLCRCIIVLCGSGDSSCAS